MRPAKIPILEVSAEEIRLVREAGEMYVYSYEVKDYSTRPPRALSEREQPMAWHDGKALLALAKRLTAYAHALKKEIKQRGGAAPGAAASA